LKLKRKNKHKGKQYKINKTYISTGW